MNQFTTSCYVFAGLVCLLCVFVFGDTLYLWWSDLVTPKKQKGGRESRMWVLRFEQEGVYLVKGKGQVLSRTTLQNFATALPTDEAFHLARTYNKVGIHTTVIMVGKSHGR